MRSSRLVTLSAALAIAPTLAACGSSSSSGPTKAQYVAKTDAICNAAATKTAPLISKLAAAGPALVSGNTKAAREIAPTLKQLHEEGAASLAELRALKPPNGQKEQVEHFLSPLTNVISAVSQAYGSLSAGQAAAALGLLAQVQTDAQQATSAAQAYGVAPCGRVLAALG